MKVRLTPLLSPQDLPAFLKFYWNSLLSVDGWYSPLAANTARNLLRSLKMKQVFIKQHWVVVALSNWWVSMAGKPPESSVSYLTLL